MRSLFRSIDIPPRESKSQAADAPGCARALVDRLAASIDKLQWCLAVLGAVNKPSPAAPIDRVQWVAKFARRARWRCLRTPRIDADWCADRARRCQALWPAAEAIFAECSALLRSFASPRTMAMSLSARSFSLLRTADLSTMMGDWVRRRFPDAASYEDFQRLPAWTCTEDSALRYSMQHLLLLLPPSSPALTRAFVHAAHTVSRCEARPAAKRAAMRHLLRELSLARLPSYDMHALLCGRSFADHQLVKLRSQLQVWQNRFISSIISDFPQPQ